jgi:pimeloyl-ACP methyl ester carboxylesterase
MSQSEGGCWARRTIDGSEFHVVPGCGHYAWVEDPEPYDGAVLPFMERVAA